MLVVASPAAAHRVASGGLAYERPAVTSLKCGTGERTSCPRGHVLRLSGEGLARTSKVIFLGRRGPRDDRSARPAERSPHRVIVSVPRSARSGPIRVVTASAAAAHGPRLRVLPGRPPTAVVTSAGAPDTAGGVFPVRGAHDFGTATNTFGGGRGHKGQDVFAKCGTPLVAALAGEVTMVKYHSRAGHYVVVKAADGTGQAYMHLRSRALVAKGDLVAAGQQLGEVGDTGRATGCHLHFELWSAPGWYEGGEAIDPLPFLRRLDGGI